jgi:hypothetical protein
MAGRKISPNPLKPEADKTVMKPLKLKVVGTPGWLAGQVSGQALSGEPCIGLWWRCWEVVVK